MAQNETSRGYSAGSSPCFHSPEQALLDKPTMLEPAIPYIWPHQEPSRVPVWGISLSHNHICYIMAPCLAVGQNQWYQFGVGEFTTHFKNEFFRADWDVHWRYDLAFDPWPHTSRKRPFAESAPKARAHRIGDCERHRCIVTHAPEFYEILAAA